MPESKQQLIDTVLCCRKGAWEIRVRSGGHSYEGSSYIANDGSSFVLIDMMNLDRVSIDLESESAWVEGGATLGQTYYAISETTPCTVFQPVLAPRWESGATLPEVDLGCCQENMALLLTM